MSPQELAESDNYDCVSFPSQNIVFLCIVVCDRNTLCHKEWQVGLKSGSGSRGTKRNFVTGARIAKSVEIWGWQTSFKSLNLILSLCFWSQLVLFTAKI